MRRTFLVVAVVTTLSMFAAATGWAASEGAQKAPIYGPQILASGFSCPTGAFPDTPTFGFVVLNTAGDESTLSGEISVKHASPNTTYEFADQQSAGKCPNLVPVGSLTTNSQGNANAHFSVPRLPGATEFWVGIATPGFTQIFGSAAVPLD